MVAAFFKAYKVTKRLSTCVEQNHVCTYVQFVLNDVTGGKGGAAVKGACNLTASDSHRLLQNSFSTLRCNTHCEHSA